MKKIKINGNVGRYVESTEAIIIADGLSFEIDNELPQNAYYEVTVSNGASKKRFRSGGDFTVSAEFLKPGALKVNIDIFTNSYKTQTIVVEDLVIYDNNGILETLPEVEQLRGEIARLENRINDLAVQVTKSNKLVTYFYKKHLGEKIC